MKSIISKVILIFFIVNIIISISTLDVQAYSNITFKNIGIEDGLSQANVEHIFQDSKGYIWIGTNDGLNKYNGYNFKVYRNEIRNKNSLASNYILNIQEDNQGNIWVANTKGISKIKSGTEEIKNYYLGNVIVTDGIVTSKGKLIFLTNDGIYLFNEKEDKFERILNNSDIINQSMYAIEEDKDGKIWVAGKFEINIINLEIEKVEKKISNKYIVKTLYYNKGSMWVGTIESGLIKFDISTGECKKYNYDKDNDKSIPSNSISKILRDKKDKVWIATNNGLAQFDEESETFITYKNKPYDKYSIVNNNVNTIMEDNTGYLWVGTYNGISTFESERDIMYCRREFLNEKSLSENSITGIYEDDEGFIWIGTNGGGLNIIDKEKEEFIKVNSTNTEYNINSDFVNDVTGKGSIIIAGTNNGLNIMDKDSRTVDVYTMEQGLISNKIKSVLLDSREYLWIGTDEGVNILNLQSKELIDITSIIKDAFITDAHIGDIYEDSEGMYWVGSFFNGGIVKLNPYDRTVKSYKHDDSINSISNNTIRVITEDDEKNLWIGTNLGLNKLNKDTEFFVNYTTIDGLANNTVYGIVIDDNKNIWSSTNLGISKFDVNYKKFSSLNVTDGLQSNEFSSKSYCKLKSGKLMFGGINGLNIFDPNEVFESSDIPNIIFDEFKVNGKELNELEDGVFKYSENTIGIKLFLPDYKNISNIQYYYMISGSNNKWMHIEGNTIVLSNLAPGKYTLKVKARNSKGEFTEENTVSFTIKPPIWKSKVTIVIYVLIIMFVVYTNRTKVKKLDYMVYKRTRELNEEMKKNEELFKKVIDLEKRKNNYLINISHELRTPLNVIYSTQQLIDQLNKCEIGISRDKLDHYMDICRRNIERLLKLINDLIDTSKIAHGSYKINIKKHDIVYIVEESALSLKDFIESKGIDLIIDPEVEECIIDCDAHEIERCIINLVSNAAKFTDKGGEILISVKTLNNCVKIEVSDTGSGIEEKYLESIFDRFNQVVDESREIRGGSGLGLTITKNIITLHHGRIYAESEVNKGSKFTIILPVSLSE